MMEYRFARPDDMPCVIDLIDLVFSQLHMPHDFEALIPKAYGPGADLSDTHAIAIADGRVVGCVGRWDFTQMVCGHPVRIGYVGSVSVHRHVRGAGIMRRLMQMQIERAQADGIDLLALDGQRQRYEYYGFVPAGGVYTYTLSDANMRHALDDTCTDGLTFASLRDEDAAYAWTLYQQQEVCGARTQENFAAVARTYLAAPWMVLKDGCRIGYLIANRGETAITEFVLEDMTLAPAVFKAWMAQRGLTSTEVCAAVHNTALNRLLAQISEGYSIGGSGMYLCLNEQRVLEAYMHLAQSADPLADGRFVLGVEGKGAFALSVQEGQVRVEKTDEVPDALVSPMEAMHLIFGFNRFSAPRLSCSVPAGWFPLPLFVPQADTF